MLSRSRSSSCETWPTGPDREASWFSPPRLLTIQGQNGYNYTELFRAIVIWREHMGTLAIQLNRILHDDTGIENKGTQEVCARSLSDEKRRGVSWTQST